MRSALTEIIEAERERFGIPGCAVVVIADAKPVLCAGFGLRDAGRELPVTTKTLFPIASATKTFTAALCALLVADGLLDLDRPAREYLPSLRLDGRDVTVLDMLCHRAGLSRHDLLWYTAPAGVTREELIGSLAHLTPNLPLRSRWQYNNMMYLTAGYLAGSVAGASFEEALTSRILEPLGMTRTYLSTAAVEADLDSAVPYVCPGPDAAVVPVPLADLDLIGPAGGINSCADDMLPWLLTLLGHGHDGGSPGLLPDEVLASLRSPRISLPERSLLVLDRPVGYGLGLIVEDYRGHRMVHHGGDIDGFTCQVSLLPEADCAVAFLANRGRSALRDALPGVVFDYILGLDPRPHTDIWFAIETSLRAGNAARSEPALELPMVRPASDYAGRYEHPAYGELTVCASSDRDGLRLSCRTLAGRLEHRHLEVFALAVDLGGSTERMPVQFFHDLDGEVSAVEVVLDSATAPVRFDRQPDLAPLTDEVLDGLAGTYRNGPLEVIVARRGRQELTAIVVQGEPAPLRYVRGLLFRLGYERVEFTGDGRLSCAAGEFTRADG